MKKILSLFILFLFMYSIKAQKLMGFSDANAAGQVQLENQYDSLIKASDQNTWMKFLSSHPHHVGSPKDKANAEYIASLFRSWGYQTEIASYYPLFPTPKVRVLELLGTNPYKCKLEEPALPGDHTSNQKTEQLPTYNVYSADGDVTAELVFVNRGVPADYEELERMGVSVKGKIVIAKYGGSWRGIKPLVAAQHGAVGCIIYSDPADDGYVKGDVYPDGPFRREDGVQRGSVMAMQVYPGDPLTPGIAATKDAKRLNRKDAETIMKIPVLPISYKDALPLLKSLKGETVPALWRGGLPITYHVGPSTAKVHLKLEFNWDIKQLYDVVAKLPGNELPDEWVIRGNHHDGWVNGAADPLSGMVAELSEAKAISELVKSGYRPKRTIIFCAWDGEEPSLLGSVEWSEDHQKELQQKAVAYINTDGNSRGFLHAEGSHSFETFFNQVAGSVIDPETHVSVKERYYAYRLATANKTEIAKILGNESYKLGALGAGSDYSGFLQHLGIPSFNLGYGGEGEGGEYHSIFDSYDMFTRFKDPGFQYGVTLSQTAGRLLMRLADAGVLPFSFNDFYKTLDTYATEVKTLLNNERTETGNENKLIKANIYALAKDPKKTYVLPQIKADVPSLNFSDLDSALSTMKKESETFQQLYDKGLQLSPEKLNELNAVLYTAEQSLLNDGGLPRRPWYKHEVYAPGYYTGYGVKTLPGIREAIEQRNWQEAQQNITIVATVLQQYNQKIQRAIDIIGNN